MTVWKRETYYKPLFLLLVLIYFIFCGFIILTELNSIRLKIEQMNQKDQFNYSPNFSSNNLLI